ncbi:MAG: 3'-5' exonuclease, partial [Bacteroidetes bacterium]
MIYLPSLLSLRRFRLQKARKQGLLPDWAMSYLDTYKQQHSAKQAWKELRFVVFDTETTGLSHRHDQVLSIGAIAVEKGNIYLGDSMELLLQREAPSQGENIAIHGIMPSESRGGIPEAEALARFLNFVRGDILVGHHVGFDIAMMEKSMKGLHPAFSLHNRAIDTARMARSMDQARERHRFFPLEEYDLDTLCRRFDIRPGDRHT